MKTTSANTLTLILVSTATVNCFADAYPYPGQVDRSNSQVCIDKFVEGYDIANAYFNGVPSSSSVKRLDLLQGGVNSASGFEALTSGKFKTEYYSLVSTYADSSGNFKGEQEVNSNNAKKSDNRITSQYQLKVASDAAISLNINHESCDSSEKIKDGWIYLYDGDWTSGDPVCYLNITLSKGSNTSICSDVSKSIADHVGAVSVTVSEIQKDSVAITGSATMTRDQILAEVASSGMLSAPYGAYSQAAVNLDCFSSGYIPYPQLARNTGESDVDFYERQRVAVNEWSVDSYLAYRAAMTQKSSFKTSVLSYLKSKTVEDLCNAIK